MNTRISLLLMLGAAACAREEVGVEVLLTVPSGGFAPRYGEVPMPNDAFRGADGKLEHIAGLEKVVKKETAAFTEQLSSLDGYGLRPLVELFLAAPIDPATLPAKTMLAGDPVALIDVEPGSPQLGAAVPMEWKFDAARSVILGSPELGTVLREGHRYAAIVTRDVHSADGRPLRGSSGLRALQEADAASQPARWKSTVEAFAALARLEPFRDPKRIAGVAVFTTQRATDPLIRARAVLEDRALAPLPELAFPDATLVFDSDAELTQLLGTAARDELGRERLGWSNGTGVAHESTGVIATGQMTTVRFVRPDVDNRPSSATFELDPATGVPRVVEQAHPIPVTFVLPKARARSAEGYPVVIFGHGLGASRHAVLTFAEPLTAAGFAIVAIDMDGHGSRFNPNDSTNNTLGTIGDGFTGAKEMADGFGDVTGIITTLGLLHGFINLSATRDSIRQSVLDLSQLAMLVARPDLDLTALAGAYGGVAPKLDARRTAYLGESYGGVIGSVFAAVEPRIELYVVDVPGAGVIDLEIANSPGLYGPVVLLARSIYELEGRFDRFHPAVALAQALVDGADPMSYATHVLRDRFQIAGRENPARSYVAIEVVGDEIMSNVGTRALAHAIGIPVLAPYLVPTEAVGEVASPVSGNAPGGRTAVMVQYSPATHGANWTSEVGTLRYVPGFPHEGEDPFPMLPAPVEIQNPIRETLEQVVEILQSHLTSPAPTVRSTLAPTPIDVTP